ncbi:hypothetical protein DFQ27_009651 [Actinomortierella ambigua]|uniref:Uncharacterized protein n=1 Tax=Actinomortierella ambigua TaxID=1343610 RepID=A0A9P6PPL2_9FUNG|nr:hypothetical protein DFQ27_009651 [Actinomortierella ambigua]
MLLSKSLLLLCSAVAVMASDSTRAIASGAIFVGKDTTVPDATPLEIFQNPKNHATAAFSVMAYAAEGAGFTPSNAPPKSLEQPFLKFLTLAPTFPGFFLERLDEFSLPLTGSLLQLEQKVRGAVVENGVLIGRSIRDLVPGYIPDETMDMWTLSLVVIDMPETSEKVTIQLVSISLDIETDDDHNAIIPEQSATFKSSVLRVNRPYFITYAEKLAKMIHITEIRDAIDFFTSPKIIENKIFAETCHGMF